MNRFLPKLFSLVLLSILAAFPCYGEVLTATAAIVQGDVAAARADAMRDILWEAGIRGDALVYSKSALLQDDSVQATVVRSAFRIRKFEVIKEELLDDRVRLIAVVEKDDLPPAACDSPLPLGNIEIDWKGVRGQRAGEAIRQGSIAFGAALKQQLRESVGAFLLPAGGSSKEAVYRLQADLEFSESGFGAWTRIKAVRVQVRAASNGALIREIQIPAEIGVPAASEALDLGYAHLRRWVLTADGHALIEALVARLSQEIRCLPPVARIPATGPDGAFLMTLQSAREIKQRSIVLYSAVWPVTENGGVDLLLIDGYLQPKLSGVDTLQFPGSKQLPGRKYPTAGGYLLFQ